MSLQDNITVFAKAVGADINVINGKIGDVTGLTTTAKTNLVLAINEVNAKASAPAGVQIDDNAVAGNTAVTYSASKTLALIAAAEVNVQNSILGGASAAYDTLKELEDKITTDSTAVTGIITALAKRVRVDAVQTFTVTEKKQGCENLGIGDPEHSFLSDYNAAKGG